MAIASGERHAAKSTEPSPGGEDRSGRSGLAKNVLGSWLGYLVTLVVGFVLPRVIDERVGQVSLGIWDLCWTLVHYMSLSMLGVGAAVNRYVARYRAVHDVESLNRTVSSVIAVQVSLASFVLVLAFILSLFVPAIAGISEASEASELRAVILFLGGSLVVQMAFDSNRGVLSGCHYWNYHNAISALGSVASSSLMIAMLLVGGGLIEMAVAYFVATLVTEIVRAFVARRICPELDCRVSLVNAKDAKKVFRFGVKTVLVGVPGIVTQQSVNLFVASFLGPAALAVFARPMALVKYSSVFIDKFAFVLTPTVGALQKISTEAVLDFTLKSARGGVLLSIPPLVFLAIMGGPLIEIWMGADYANPLLILVLAIGYVIPMSQRPVLHILIGLNQHGKLMVNGVLTSIIILVAVLSYVTYTGWSLIGAAVAAVLPLSFGYSLLVPYYACKHLGIGLKEFVLAASDGCFLLLLVSISGLLTVKFAFDGQPVLQVVLGAATLATTTAFVLRSDILDALKQVRS